MVDAAQMVQLNAQLMQVLLANAVRQNLEQSVDLATLNVQLATGGSPEGVGQQIDVMA